MVVSELKHAVSIGPATQLAKTQAIQNGLNGIMHAPAQAGQTAILAPDFATGMKKREIKVSKIIIFNYIIC